MVRAIVGGNWGDEGKGKMTDVLCADSDIVVRFQGGANAGHTIINERGRFALHLLPSGVLSDHIVNVIGQGVAMDLGKFFAELTTLREAGIEPKLLISDRAQVLLPLHVLLDVYEEERLSDRQFGSTKSGIAPFYADKYRKVGIQLCQLYDDALLRERLWALCDYVNLLMDAVYHKPHVDPQAIYNELIGYREPLRPFLADTSLYLDKAIKQGKRILLEGQLGALRDPDNGIYPFTTSSSPLAGFATVGAGIPPCAITEVITVVKAYSSCVGAGAFVTELFDEEGQQLRDRGGDKGEYGATTGRPRRVGWFDMVASRYGCMLQGTTAVALSLVDVLGYLDKIPVCTGYAIDGEVVTDFPNTPQLGKAQPIYTYLEGWKCDIRGADSYEALPQQAKDYIAFVEKGLGYPVKYISTGPSRDHIIYR